MEEYSLPQCPISQDSITATHIHIAAFPADLHDKSITSEDKGFNGTIGRQLTMPFEKYLKVVNVFSLKNMNFAVVDIWLESRVIEHGFHKRTNVRMNQDAYNLQIDGAYPVCPLNCH